MKYKEADKDIKDYAIDAYRLAVEKVYFGLSSGSSREFETGMSRLSFFDKILNKDPRYGNMWRCIAADRLDLWNSGRYAMHPYADNEKNHEYIKKFFNYAVRNLYKISREIEIFKKREYHEYSDDPNVQIIDFLHSYARTKIQFEKEGKQIFEPEVFKEYPFLEEYMEGAVLFEKFAEKVEILNKKDNISTNELEELVGYVAEAYAIRASDKDKAMPEMNRYFVEIKHHAENVFNALKSQPKMFEEVKAMCFDKFEEIIPQSEKNKQDYNMNQETSKKLEDKQKWLEEKQKLFEEKQKLFDEKVEQYQQSEASSVNANEDIANMTDEQRKANFDAKHKLMKEHPIMLEACLSSMCMAYHLAEDNKAKQQMLADLYSIRKGGETNKDKREMAKAFQRVLERTPSLKENENLVALSKIDVSLHQPTNSVQKQLKR